MGTFLFDMTPVFLSASLCMAVGRFAAVTDVRRSPPTLQTVQVIHVLCNTLALTTRASEQDHFDVPQMIVKTTRRVAVCCCSAFTDVRTN